MNRRKYLAAAAATAALAGCLGGDESDTEPTDDDPEDDADDDPEDDADDDPEDDADDTEPEEETEDEDEDEDEEIEQVDDFEDLDRWEVVVGSLTADEERSYTGSQSALLEAEAEEEGVRIVRELDEPRDFSEMRPGVAMASSATAAPIIQLADSDGDRIDFRQQVHSDTPLTRSSFGIANVDGDPNLTDITEIQIIRWTGEEYETQLWVDDLHFVPAPEQGTVLLQFDGGHETDYTDALPVLEEYDYQATSFVTTGRLREEEDHDGDRLTHDQLAELDDAGWTIASHSAHGSNLASPPEDREQEDEISDARAWLEDNGYEDGADYFSYPQNKYNGETLELVEEHHELGFAGRFPSQGYAANPALCSRVINPDADEARAALETTSEWGGITAIVFYELDAESLSALEATAEYLDGSDELEVIGPDEMAAEYVIESGR
ncbi:polysaccharide deacetylase family protein [Natrarchaeobius chitinivorans]|uniref:Polysaccharide deacetylase n=1 Tax=Natrarchaeobius chitinivorans TaxID=1679083 RepID=A0A3N6M300_NATCH|nr:polysaccharide deacetylase family protein [Natrarchaeobius chitinivorans]RQG97823.1 polysaccharide deacetylase [Natrarchaeobius chitinivorans]